MTIDEAVDVARFDARTAQERAAAYWRAVVNSARRSVRGTLFCQEFSASLYVHARELADRHRRLLAMRTFTQSFERCSDEVPLDEQEVRELLADLGIDADAELARALSVMDKMK